MPTDRDLDEQFLKHHCGTVLEAVERICAWVE